MKNIIEKIYKSFEKLNIEDQRVLSHTPSGLKSFLYAYLFEKQKKPLVIVCSDNQNAESIEKQLKEIDIPVYSLPFYDILPYENENITPSVLYKRVQALFHIMNKKNAVYLIPLKSFLFPLTPLNKFSEFILKLKKGENCKRMDLQEFLVQKGYKRMPHVEGVGDYSLRGELLDIYSPQYENPLRIEFFDEEVERIRFFNLEDQSSIKDSEQVEVSLLPIFDFEIEEKQVEALRARLEADFPPDLVKRFSNYTKQYPHDVNYLPFIFFSKGILDFFKEAELDSKLIWDQFSQLKSLEKTYNREVKEMYYGSFNLDKIKIHPNQYFNSVDQFESLESLKLLNLEEEQDSLKLSSYFSTLPVYRGRIELFRNHLKDWEGYDIYVGCSYKEQMQRVSHIFPELKTILSGSLEKGFVDHTAKMVFVMESEIFGKKYSNDKRQAIFLSSAPIESFSDLERGDYVVHVQHGIGRYEGIEKVSVMGKVKDYIKIAYADDENLYTPVEQVFLIHKYLGASGRSPKLDKIGGKAWESKKEKVKKKMEEMAEELALLYEKRRQLKGFQYPEDNQWQEEFEAGFPYRETPDQLKAINDVKNDMCSPVPMDRLVCGDVGYGKTEVAMRAAFKAVSSGKQVAMLVPTTLLAEQHYKNFLERFDNFPVNIKMLSRLVTAKEEKQILQDLRGGDVDILVGTHKILGKKIEYKDLGLLIIDEEQRFGVKHKEVIKQLKSSIDVLTLSATPIPRTLYMGISNLRDMSLIATAPSSRMSVKTHVMPFNDNILKMAIQREVERGGQVFIIHNRVKTIETFASFLIRLIPDLNIAIGHAKLSPSDMEGIFMDFINGKYDVLLSTTIVENGIDIANANTIIIDMPELLGLSELYQLRGRVGRGDKQGYAYLFYDPVRGLSADVQKRLEAIEEHTELGSGFKIAMRDLEIRGAGNLLGKDQSGLFSDVGLELYSKIMQSAVNQVKGMISEEEVEPLMDLVFNGYIPEDYILEEKERFSIYKLIMRASKESEVDSLKNQIKDRYGTLPETVENLVLVSRIKLHCKKLGIKELKEEKNIYLLSFLSQPKADPQKIGQLMAEKKATLSSLNRLQLKKDPIYSDNTLEEILNYLSFLTVKEETAKS